MKFYEGHEEEDSKHDVVLHVDGESRVAQIPYTKTPFKTLTESVENSAPVMTASIWPLRRWMSSRVPGTAPSADSALATSTGRLAACVRSARV